MRVDRSSAVRTPYVQALKQEQPQTHSRVYLFALWVFNGFKSLILKVIQPFQKRQATPQKPEVSPQVQVIDEKGKQIIVPPNEKKPNTPPKSEGGTKSHHTAPKIPVPDPIPLITPEIRQHTSDVLDLVTKQEHWLIRVRDMGLFTFPGEKDFRESRSYFTGLIQKGELLTTKLPQVKELQNLCAEAKKASNELHELITKGIIAGIGKNSKDEAKKGLAFCQEWRNTMKKVLELK